MNNILIVDDHQIIYDGMTARLKKEFNLFYAPDAAGAKEIAFSQKISTAVLDINLKEESGFDLALELKKAVRNIVFFTMHKSPTYIRQAQEIGCQGYFLKDEPLDSLVSYLRHPCRCAFFTPDSVKPLLEKQSIEGNDRYDSLTAREQQIFRMIAEGMKPKEIAGKLNISSKTISVHRENLMRKLQVDNNIDLVKYAIRIGIVAL